MREHELGDLLRASVDQVREPDLARVTWEKGRRRRRHRSVVGGVVGAGSTAGVVALLLLGPWAGGPPGREPTTSPSAGIGVPAPMPLDPGSAAAEQGRQVWVQLYSACLDDRGYAVTLREDGLAASRSDVVAGERDRDLARCRAELVLDAPAQVVSLPAPDAEGAGPGVGVRAESDRWGVDEAGTQALTGRYQDYGRVNRCLSEAGLPAGSVPTVAGFVQDYAWAQVPPWHPYLEAAEQGRYAEARDACPIPRTTTGPSTTTP